MKHKVVEEPEENVRERHRDQNERRFKHREEEIRNEIESESDDGK